MCVRYACACLRVQVCWLLHTYVFTCVRITPNVVCVVTYDSPSLNVCLRGLARGAGRICAQGEGTRRAQRTQAQGEGPTQGSGTSRFVLFLSRHFSSVFGKHCLVLAKEGSRETRESSWRAETQRKQLYTPRVKTEKRATKSAKALAKAMQARTLTVEGFC